MFGLFKRDPVKKFNKLLLAKQEQAMLAQRRGDIRSFSKLSAEAEEILKQIKEIEESSESK